MLANPKLLEFFKDIGKYAQDANKEIYLVGGSVRDFLYHSKNKSEQSFDPRDIDIVVNANAIKFIKNYQATLERINKSDALALEIIDAFDAFGTIKVQLKSCEDYDIEFASARSELYPKPAVFPKVKLIDNIKDDLIRRDFTINALLESLMPDNFAELVDYVSGLEDYNSALIRVFHDQSFIDDPTRIFRAARFMAKLNFQIEEHTLKLMKEAARHEDFPKWYKKRKSRFQIEYDFIKALPEPQFLQAQNLLKSILLVDLPE